MADQKEFQINRYGGIFLLYKHLVRSHLEYCNSVWAPYKKSYIDKLEKVQKRATNIIPEWRKMHYPDRLKQLNLLSRSDMIETYKLLTGKSTGGSSVTKECDRWIFHKRQVTRKEI